VLIASVQFGIIGLFVAEHPEEDLEQSLTEASDFYRLYRQATLGPFSRDRELFRIR
jgi:hypothetical protein